MRTLGKNNKSHLTDLESESIFILRETAAQFKSSCLLFSGGKDSMCLLHLAIKAFAPCPLPFQLLHIDTGHNFPEVLAFRDQLIKKLDLTIYIRKVETKSNINEINGMKEKFPSRNALQSQTLLQAIKELKFDACIGGARRDEEKSRSKERIFSIRDAHGKWQPENQRPELWNMFNGEMNKNEHMRVFPLSNWTELDIWNYVQQEKILLPSLYFSHVRKCLIVEAGRLMPVSPFMRLDENDIIVEKKVRFRTVGDMTCTAAIESDARNVRSVIDDLRHTNMSERGQTRVDDRISETAMEDRKLSGYF